MSSIHQSQAAPCCGYVALKPGTSHLNEALMNLSVDGNIFEVQGNGKLHHISSLPLVISLHSKQILALLEFYSSRGIAVPSDND